MLGRSSLLKVRRSQPVYPDYVQEYINRVIAADAAAGNSSGLEYEVTDAIDACLQSLVADGILGVSGGALSQSASLIKAGCFMMGARTLPGALVPFAADMPAPTNFNFVAENYNRRTGLGDPGNVSKYLNSNRNNNTESLTSVSISVYVTTAPSLNSSAFIGVASGGTAPGSDVHIGRLDANNIFSRVRNSARTDTSTAVLTGLVGASRGDSSSYLVRSANVTLSVSQAVNSNLNSFPHFVFSRNINGNVDGVTNARLSFYHIGSALDLAVLDARITALSNAIQAAIAP